MTTTSSAVSSSRSTALDGPVVLTRDVDGYAVVPDTPLTWTNFFDGRPMRAADFTAEQQTIIDHARLGLRAGGFGVAFGLDVTRPPGPSGQPGELCRIEAGLAFDAAGRAVLLTQRIEVTIPDLIATTTRAGRTDREIGAAGFAPCVIDGDLPVAASPSGTVLYLLTAGWVQGRCGHVEVFGRACGDTCGCGGGCERSSDRPFRVDGVVFRLRPLTLATPWEITGELSGLHLRSRVASAAFADERAATRWAMSAALLASTRWQAGTSPPVSALGLEVPLALVARSGGGTLFHDEWTARRERTEAPPQPAFDARVGARPAAIFHAQVNQFQTQLAEVAGLLTGPTTDQLFRNGFVELPSAGFLPVDPARPLTAQCAALFGDRVDVRLLAVPRDQIPHEIEAAAHRDRIPLRTVPPAIPPKVDVLVPDGVQARPGDLARLFALDAILTQPRLSPAGGPAQATLAFVGSGRRVDRSDRGLALFAAAVTGVTNAQDARTFVDLIARRNASPPPVLVGKPLDDDLVDLIADHAVAAARRFGAKQIDTSLLSGRLDAQQSKPIAAWCAVEAGPAPWLAADDETVALTLTLELSAPTGPSAVVTTTVALEGELSRRQPATPTEALWTFRGVARIRRGTSITDHLVGVDVDQVRSGSFWEFRVAGLGALRLSASAAGGERIEVALAERLTVDLVASPNVAQPTDAHRGAGERSLSLLRLADPADELKYQRRRERLFGRPDDQPEAAITGPYDWVAFRRRGPRAEAPVVVPPPDPEPELPDIVQVAIAVVDTEEQIDDASRDIRLTGGSPSLVFDITFEAGTATYQGESPVVLVKTVADKLGSFPLPMVHLVGFAPGNMAAGADRAQAVAQTLSGPGLTPEALPIDPGTFGDASGRVMLLIGPTPRRDDVDVVIVAQESAQPAGLWDDLLPQLANDDPTALLQAVDAGLAPTLLSLKLAWEASDITAARPRIVDAIDGAEVHDATPLLLLDRDWAEQQPAPANRASIIADRLLDQLVTPNNAALPLKDTRKLPLPAPLSRAVLLIMRGG